MTRWTVPTLAAAPTAMFWQKSLIRARHEVERRIRSKYHRDLFFDKTLEIEIINLRAAAKERRIRKVETMILAHGWDDLETIWKHRAEKLLDDDRIDELTQCHRAGQLAPAQASMPQLSIFLGDTSTEKCVTQAAVSG